MLRRVLDLGFDRLATGHYARIVDGPNGPELHEGPDPAKDQSYMLYHLDRERLARIAFPLGAMTKSEVREHAREFGLPVAAKAESQEICFVPRGATSLPRGPDQRYLHAWPAHTRRAVLRCGAGPSGRALLGHPRARRRDYSAGAVTRPSW